MQREMLTVAMPPTHERESRPAGRGDGPLNWGWIALGGCLGLAAILLLNPVSLSLVGMIIGSWQEQRASDRWQTQATAEAAAPVCLDAPLGVLARIEAGLRTPDFRLRGVRAVHSSLQPDLWVIAADVESVGGDP